METVYALHDFVGENEDEITFYVGEPIFVVEKDELYNDGWWQGRNVRGDVGLFPSNYVSSERPLPITEEDDDTDLDIPPPTAFLNGHESIYCESSMSPMFPDAKMPSLPDTHNGAGALSETSSGTLHPISTSESTLHHNETGNLYTQLTSPDLAFPTPPADIAGGNKRSETIRRPEVDSWHINGWSPSNDKALEPIPELPTQYRKNSSEPKSTTLPTQFDTTKALPKSPPLSSSPIKSFPNDSDVTAKSDVITNLQTPVERTSSAPPPPSTESVPIDKAVVTPSSATTAGLSGHSRAASQSIQSIQQQQQQPISSTSSPVTTTLVAKQTSITRSSIELRDAEVSINAPQPQTSLSQPLTTFRQSPDSTVSVQSTPEEETGRRHHTSSRTSVASDSHSKTLAYNNSMLSVTQVEIKTETKHEQPLTSPIPTTTITTTTNHIEERQINDDNSSYNDNNHNNNNSNNGSTVKEDGPASWNVDQVANWLDSVGLSSVVPEFRKHEITGDVLLDLNITMLKELDISSFGRRYHIMQAISNLRTNNVLTSTLSSNDAIPSNRSIRGSNFISHGHLDSMRTDSRASMRSASSNNSNSALSRGPPIRQELYDNMSATATMNNAYRRAPHLSGNMTLPRRSPSRPISTMSFGSDAPLATAVYSAGIENSFASTPPKPDIQLSPVCESHDLTMETGNSNDYRSSVSKVPSNYTLHQSRQHQRTPSMPITWNQPESPQQQIHSEPASRKPSFSRTVSPTNMLPSIPTTLARPMHYQEAAPEIGSLARQSGVPRPDHQGWLRRQTLGPVKVWKRRWFILKNGQLFSSKTPNADRIKPVISIAGCRITPDPNANPGYYGFRITPSNKHPDRRVQVFCYDDEDATKAWIKCLIKATIGRDPNAPVVSSCTVATVPLNVARDMAPRPPSAVFSGSPMSPVSPQKSNDTWGLPNIDSEPFTGGDITGNWEQQQQQSSTTHTISPPLSKPVSSSSISTQERGSTINTNTTTGTYHHHHHHPQHPRQSRQMLFERFDTRSRPASEANGAPIGQRVSGIMRTNQEGGEEKRQSKPRMSVMSRLSRAVEDSTGRRSISRGGHSITLLTRQSHLSSSSIGNNSNQERLSLQKQQYQSHASVVATMTDVPEEPDQYRRSELVPKLLNWVNRYLVHAGYHVNDLTVDLRSGHLLLRFMEELSGYKLTSTIPEARETGHPVDDMSTAFHFLHTLNVNMKGYTTADILVGKEEKVVCMLLSIQQAFPSSVPADFYQ